MIFSYEVVTEIKVTKSESKPLLHLRQMRIRVEIENLCQIHFGKKFSFSRSLYKYTDFESQQ